MRFNLDNSTKHFIVSVLALFSLVALQVSGHDNNYLMVTLSAVFGGASWGSIITDPHNTKPPESQP